MPQDSEAFFLVFMVLKYIELKRIILLGLNTVDSKS